MIVSFMLQAILGTKTKLKILEQLCTYPEGLNRYALAKLSKVNVRVVYEQIEDLVFLDIVKHSEKIYYLNKSHPLYETICSLFVLETEIVNTMEYSIHGFLHDKLQYKYYIGGYDAAMQYVTSLDYTENIIHIGMKRDIYKEMCQKLQLLNAFDVFSFNQLNPEKLSIIAFPIDTIHDDIIKGTIHGHEVYIASVTRGIVECFIYSGISTYGKCLLLLYNAYEKLLDNNLFVKLYKQNLFPPELIYIINLSLEHELNGFSSIMGKITKMYDLSEKERRVYYQAFIEAKRTIYGEER